MKTILFKTVISAVLGVIIVLGVATDQFQLWRQPKFVNEQGAYKTSGAEFWGMIKEYAVGKRVDVSPNEPMPLQSISATELERREDRVYRLGHSTLLIQLDGKWILTDPVFSERSSPLQSIGPKRFHPTPIAIEELPPLDAVVISHDHYDHLDKHSIRQLAERVTRFIVPTAVGDYLIDWGVAESKITELAWWQHTKLADITITATPAHHFSGRGLVRDRTLWASYVLAGAQHKLFFSGDSGYFPGFKQIGERYGPFDLTMMELGAYNELWSAIHMSPSESVQAHIDLRGKAMLPIHNSTFDLALHPWYEPLRQAKRVATEREVVLVSPQFGRAVPISNAASTPSWIP